MLETNKLNDSAVLMQDVSVKTVSKIIVDNINLKVQHNERILMLGPNGSGKSSLLKILAGLLNPTGKVEIFGSNVDDMFVKQRRAYLPQEIDYPPRIKIKEIINFVANHYPPKEDNSTILAQYNLNPEEYAASLSGGQKRRFALALALLGQPKLILLDEPEAGLDVQFRETAIKEIIDQASKQDMTLIMTSHLFENVVAYFTRVIIMKAGKLILDSPVDKLISFKNEIKRWDVYGEDSDKITHICNIFNIKPVTLGNQYFRIYGVINQISEPDILSQLKMEGFLMKEAPTTMEDIYLYYTGEK